LPRLDVFLLNQGFARSRSLAAKLVRSGFVYVNGKQAEKPSLEIFEDDRVEILENALTRYVSRGGLKLEAALEEFSVSPEGFLCADIGASTGGFTDCLLQHGAAKVYAVDSGSGQLHPSLRDNVCVVSMENTNARFLDESLVPPVDLVVMDVSFISQKLLYPAVMKILKERGIFISLIKPQFEVGLENIGKGGIVRDEKKRKEAVETVVSSAETYGLVCDAVIPSPIRGGDGNIEFLACFQKRNHPEEREESYEN